MGFYHLEKDWVMVGEEHDYLETIFWKGRIGAGVDKDDSRFRAWRCPRQAIYPWNTGSWRAFFTLTGACVGDFDTRQGFGLPCVAGDASGYAHGSELSCDALSRARDVVKAVKRSHENVIANGCACFNQ